MEEGVSRWSANPHSPAGESWSPEGRARVYCNGSDGVHEQNKPEKYGHGQAARCCCSSRVTACSSREDDICTILTESRRVSGGGDPAQHLLPELVWCTHPGQMINPFEPLDGQILPIPLLLEIARDLVAIHQHVARREQGEQR